MRGRVVRWCSVNFQCRGVLLIWIRVGQGPTALAVGAGGGCLDIFSLVCHFSFLSPSLWETARYRLKYYLKGPLSPKTTNQPTLNALISHINFSMYNIFAFLRTYFPYVSSITNNSLVGWILTIFENLVVVSTMVWKAILELS